MSRRSRSFFFDVSTGTLKVADASVSTTTLGEENYGSVADAVTTSIDYDLVTDGNVTFLDYGAVEDTALVQAVSDTLVNSFRIDTSSLILQKAFEIKTASFVAENGGNYLIGTSTGAVTVTLPASPSAGHVVRIVDADGAAATNNITVDPNGNNILGSASSVTIAVNDTKKAYVYYNASRGWVEAT